MLSNFHLTKTQAFIDPIRLHHGDKNLVQLNGLGILLFDFIDFGQSSKCCFVLRLGFQNSLENLDCIQWLVGTEYSRALDHGRDVSIIDSKSLSEALVGLLDA